MRKNKGKIIPLLLGAVAICTAAVLGIAFFLSSSSIHELLTENRALNKAIRNLTQETAIGFAVIQDQFRDESGELFTVVRFVETAASSPDQIVSEQLFTLPGDVIHFDALVVKFTDEYVKDGKERALYLWRRIYSEKLSPENAEIIQEPGKASERYYDISKSLNMKDRKIFWSAVWDLANEPEELSEYGVKAVFGNVNYLRMVPDKLYRFKITSSGQIYPEVSARL